MVTSKAKLMDGWIVPSDLLIVWKYLLTRCDCTHICGCITCIWLVEVQLCRYCGDVVLMLGLFRYNHTETVEMLYLCWACLGTIRQYVHCGLPAGRRGHLR